MAEPPLSQSEYWNVLPGETWAANAHALDRLMSPAADALLAALALAGGQHVLDIGCGGGRTTLAIAERTGRATGVDISASLLRVARARAAAAGSPAQFVLADAGVDPLPDAPYDAQSSRFGVMFFDQPASAFAYLRSALAPGRRWPLSAGGQ